MFSSSFSFSYASPSFLSSLGSCVGGTSVHYTTSSLHCKPPLISHQPFRFERPEGDDCGHSDTAPTRLFRSGPSVAATHTHTLLVHCTRIATNLPLLDITISYEENELQ